MFDADSGIDEVLATAARIHDDNPLNEYHFDFNAKAGAPYKLPMPKFNLALAAEFRHIGSSNGFEIYQMLTSKLDSPRTDNMFHLASKIQGLGRTDVCRGVAQTTRFVAFLESRIKEFLVETGEIPPTKTRPEFSAKRSTRTPWAESRTPRSGSPTTRVSRL